MISDESSKVDWASLLLDENTDDMIITVSREKIAHEIIRLRTENKHLQMQTNSTSMTHNFKSDSLRSQLGNGDPLSEKGSLPPRSSA